MACQTSRHDERHILPTARENLHFRHGHVYTLRQPSSSSMKAVTRSRVARQRPGPFAWQPDARRDDARERCERLVTHTQEPDNSGAARRGRHTRTLAATARHGRGGAEPARNGCRGGGRHATADRRSRGRRRTKRAHRHERGAAPCRAHAVRRRAAVRPRQALPLRGAEADGVHAGRVRCHSRRRCGSARRTPPRLPRRSSTTPRWRSTRSGR